MKPKISVIIVNWNVAESLKRCLESIFATKYPNLEVIVIDNASTDDTLGMIKDVKVNLIKNLSNVGFPKAVNIGLRQSRGEYILILNPDTRLPSDFFIKSLDFFLSHPDAFLMGPKFLNPDGTPQGSVFPEPSIINTFREFWLGQAGLTRKYSPRSQTEVFAVSGACMFFPKSTVVKIGKFTEEVFMYYEDLDYCRRIRNRGGKVYFNPQVVIVHEHGQSSKQTSQAQRYLWQSSLWYNGFVKHHLMWLISLFGQKLRPKSL